MYQSTWSYIWIFLSAFNILFKIYSISTHGSEQFTLILNCHSPVYTSIDCVAIDFILFIYYNGIVCEVK